MKKLQQANPDELKMEEEEKYFHAFLTRYPVPLTKSFPSIKKLAHKLIGLLSNWIIPKKFTRRYTIT